MIKTHLTKISLLLGLIAAICIDHYGIIDQYFILILTYLGINIMLTLSLNLVNGYMGEFSVGHAGFMAIGAYAASFITVKIAPEYGVIVFPLALVCGGLLASVAGLIVALPSFKTRGDYLAIVTLAFNMIVKSVIENVDTIGGAKGFLGMDKLTNLTAIYLWTLLTLFVIRNLVYSNYGRAILAVREDETASILTGVNTRKTKVIAFMVSAFFAGVAGGLLAHTIQFISPRMFDIIKSTEVLVMVYLGGIGSIAGSIIGATAYTLLLEILRPLEIWRMVIMPLMLVFLMLFMPRGIMGMRELSIFIPQSQRILNPEKGKVEDRSKSNEGQDYER